MAITFHTADIQFSLRNRIALRRFITAQVLKASGYKSLNISFVFCSDEYLLNINRQFLQHDYYTDIITFPLSESKEALEAEIYISIERVRENAGKFTDNKQQTGVVPFKSPNSNLKAEQAFLKELHRVLFHGVLHLLGYKDKTKSNQLEMRNMEDIWINRFERAIGS